jgi:hypothetical protein
MHFITRVTIREIRLIKQLIQRVLNYYDKNKSAEQRILSSLTSVFLPLSLSGDHPFILALRQELLNERIIFEEFKKFVLEYSIEDNVLLKNVKKALLNEIEIYEKINQLELQGIDETHLRRMPAYIAVALICEGLPNEIKGLDGKITSGGARGSTLERKT